MRSRLLPAVLLPVLCAYSANAIAQKCLAPSFKTPAPQFAVGTVPGDIAKADFNNDGLMDVAVGDAGRVQVFLGNGIGFVYSATVAAAGTYAVATGDINNDGNADIAIATNAAATIVTALGNGAGAFGAPTPIAVGPAVPRALDLVDVNKDAALDIIYGDAAAPGIAVLLGNGFGGFGVGPAFPMPFVSEMAVADLDNDGKVDVVATDTGADQIVVALGQGGGVFAAGGAYATGISPWGLSVADFTSDGRLDVVTADQGSGQISVLQGLGTGAFTPLPPLIVPDPNLSFLAHGDFDGDGALDLVAPNLASQQATVFLGGGGGVFSPGVFVVAPSDALDLVVADFNLDGRDDFAATLNVAGTFALFENDYGIACAAASFDRLGRLFTVGPSPRAVATGDFDHDGYSDVATADQGAATITVRLRNGLDLLPPTPYASGSSPISIASGDFTSDGFLDLVVANQGSNNLSVMLNDSTGDFGTRLDFSIGAVPAVVVAKDVNIDGKLDAIVTASDGNVHVAFGDGTGNLGGFSSYPAGASPGAIAVADFDGDGLPDLAITKTTPNEVVILNNLGDGTFGTATPFPVGGVVTNVQPGQFGGGAALDLVLTYGAGAAGRVQTWFGDGGLGFSPGPNTPILGAALLGHGLAVDDFDGNGAMDVAVANATRSSLNVLLGNGTGGFPTMRASVLGTTPSAITAEDFDRDGTADLISAQAAINRLAIFLNEGTARFRPDFFPSTDTDNRGVGTGDFNHDGILDLVVGNAGNDSLAFYRGLGSGQFAPPTDHPTSFPQRPVWVTVDDFNADGHLDVVLTVEAPSSVVLYHGDGTGDFAPPLVSVTTFGPVSVTRAADINLDGTLELAVIAGTQVEILQDAGGGNYFTAGSIGLGGAGAGLELGDFDHDGDIDVATTQITDDVLDIHWGSAILNSWFGGPQINLSANPLIFGSGDVNSDGLTDFIVPEDSSNQVTLVVSTGIGTWSVGPTYPTQGSPFMAASTDFNLDGDLDFVASIRSGHQLGFFGGDGAGGFFQEPYILGLALPAWLATGDFDGNGRDDIAVVPDTIVAGSPPAGVAVALNTNCLPQRLVSVIETSTCHAPGAPFATQPRVSIVDDGRNAVQCDLAPVLASLVPGTGTPGAVLFGAANPQAPLFGSILYSDLGIDLPGGGYQLEFTHPTAPHRLYSNTFSQGLEVTMDGPLGVCQGDPAIYTVDDVFEMYNWELDTAPQTMAPAADLTAVLIPGLHTLDVTVEQDTCSANDNLLFNVTETLSSVTIGTLGIENVCDICKGAKKTSSVTGGGTLSYQWGYRSVSLGPITPIPWAVGPTYTIDGNDFPAPTTYYLVLTVTPSCGAPLISNEIQVDVTSATAANPVVAFTARSTNTENLLEWATPPTGACVHVRVIQRSDGLFPTDPNDIVTPNFHIGDFACPSAAVGKDSTSDMGLANAVTYRYSAWVFDGTNYSARKEVAGRPFDNTVGAIRWAYATGGSSLAPPGLRPVGGVGTIYIVSNDNLVHAVTDSGVWPPAWKPYPMSLPAQSRPPIPSFSIGSGGAAAGGGALFVGSQDGDIYVIDADEGDLVWKNNVGVRVQGAPAGMFPEYGGLQDLVLASTRDGSSNWLRAYDVDSGAPAWLFQNMPIHGGDGSPIGIISGGASIDYGKERVFFASHKSGNYSVWALDFSTDPPQIEWARDLGNMQTSPIYLPGAPARLLVANTAGDVELLDPDAGGASVWGAPYNALDGGVKGFVFPHFGTPNYIISTISKVTSIRDNGDGSHTQFWQISVANASIPLVVTGTNTALVGSNNGEIIQIDDIDTMSPGTRTVTLGDGTAIVGAPTLHGGAASRIYVGTTAGVVYALSWPLPP